MFELLDKIKNFKVESLLAWALISQVLGFLIWETYLFLLGYIENDILQARFILTGAFFLFLCFFLLKLKRLLAVKLNLFKKESFLIFLAILWFFVYVVLLFPFVPLVLGGGHPRSMTIVTDKAGMEVLSSLEINSGNGATYQTRNVCIVYESFDWFVFVEQKRVLALRTDNLNLQGYASLGGMVRTELEPICARVAWGWIVSGVINVLTNIVNEFTPIEVHSTSALCSVQ